MNLFPAATVPTRLSPHWQWESSVRTKSPRPCSPLRTGAALPSEFHQHGAPTIIRSSIHSSTSPPQVHLLLQRPAVQHHQNEQQPFVPPPDPHSIAPKLPSRRRSVFNADFRLRSSLVGMVVECCVSVSCRFLPLSEDLPVSAARLHLCRLVSTQQVASLHRCVSTGQKLSIQGQRLCLGVGKSVLILQLLLFTPILPNWDMFGLCFVCVWSWCGCIFCSFCLFTLRLCLSSDPQSSRARKLCMTMEPALLLKGDIMVRNGFSWLPRVSSENLSKMNHQLRWFKLLINHFTKPLFYSLNTHWIASLRTSAWLFLNHLSF